MRYFGTDGIRGKAYETLNETLAIKVGKALCLLDSRDVLIGYDTRESSLMLADAIKKGALSVGKNVYVIGIIPTPGVAFNSIINNCIGIMITASHNPYYDNGIKIFDNGLKLSHEKEQEIEDYIDTNDAKLEEILYIDNKSNHAKKYVKFLKNKLNYSPLNIGLDLANGATSNIAYEVFNEKVKGLYITANNPDGKNINDNVGSTHIESIIKLVQENQLDIGFSFDGDGDRLLVVDGRLNVYSGDQIIYILAKYLKDNGLLNHNKVILTIMSNLGILQSLNKLGIDYELTQVGDKYVLEKMLANNYVLGGENSGHIINLLNLPTGDGMLSAITLLNVLSYYNLSLKELCCELTIYPEKLVNIKVNDKNVINNNKIIEKIDEIKKEYVGIQLIVRASGTEDLIRISCCYKDLKVVDNVIENLSDMIRGM